MLQVIVSWMIIIMRLSQWKLLNSRHLIFRNILLIKFPVIEALFSNRCIRSGKRFHIRFHRFLDKQWSKEKYISPCDVHSTIPLCKRPLLGDCIGSSRNAAGLCSNLPSVAPSTLEMYRVARINWCLPPVLGQNISYYITRN